MNVAAIDRLSSFLRAEHRCEGSFLHWVWVEETHKQRPLWRGLVAVFRLELHGERIECYAWLHDELQGRTAPVAILRTGAIDSPAAAVRHYLLQLCQDVAA